MTGRTRTAGSPNRRWVRCAVWIGWFVSSSLLSVATGGAQSAESESGSQWIARLSEELSAIRAERHAEEEYRAAAAAYRRVLAELEQAEPTALSFDDRVDRDLLVGHAKTRLFEIEELALHRLVPVRYLALSTTDSLFLRPCAAPDATVERAVAELDRLPEILANGRKQLENPARTWTENALYTASYAEDMLEKDLPTVCTDSEELGADLLRAGQRALQALREFSHWMETELLPRSNRSPAWSPQAIEFYQFVHEGLTDYGVDEMVRMAEVDEQETLEQMRQLAARIHPSGDLATVWDVMKDEAPPWSEVPAMAARYVELADAWLRGPGSHLVSIPERFDYGVAITSPMARRILSFGGASYGPTLAGRISGYYVITPLEDRLTEAEKASRIRSYNPYWTHVISYHEWLGHNVQRAVAETFNDRPARSLFRSIYLSQAWSFYLEKLLEDEGYFEDVLPHMEALKTRMARLQMRMWRVQRILTKLKMAQGEMTFDEAVEAYVEKIGMERTNALIEVQRDSQSPSPPGREIIGEHVIFELREEYERRFGEHFELGHFHEGLLRFGELPLPVVRKLLFEGR